MSFDIQGKVALVTGANRGMGKVITESLIEAGAKAVYAAVRRLESVKSMADEHGGKLRPIHIDLEIPGSMEAAAKEASDVHLVVNNAGALRLSGPLDKDAIDSLRHEIDVNVFGLIRMAQAFAPVLKANGGGAFVQINSVASMKCFADFATYSASKAAAYSVTQALREMLQAQGTAVISVHPGPIDTDMAKKAGLADIASPPSLVAHAIIEALRSGAFHVFPDSVARQIGEAHSRFAEDIVESEMMIG